MQLVHLLLASLATLAAAQSGLTIDAGETFSASANGTLPSATSITSRAASSVRSSTNTRSGSVTPTITSEDDMRPRLPGERQDSRGSLEASVPLGCLYACSERLGNYFFCYETEAAGPSNKANFCNRLFCNQETYDQLRQCLNCILANGEESTLPASFTSQLTEPIEWLDREVAAKWMRTVGESCAAAGSSLSTTTLTATPTTTGPYYTSWTSGGTVDIPVWTGVTQYTEAIFRATRTPTPGEASGGLPSDTGSSSQGASSSAAPAASSTGAAHRRVSAPLPFALLAQLL